MTSWAADVEVAVSVSQVQEQELPELDDDFAQEASEFDTVEELTADVRERLGRGKRLEQAAAARDAVLEVLLEQVEIPLPETLVADELTARRQSVEQQLAYAGITMESYLDDEGQTVDEFEADLEKRVRDAVAAQFILDEVAKKEELGVDQSELSEHLVRRAQQSGQDPQEFANHMFEHNHVPEMIQEILRGKALATIVESAVVKDASGAVVDLKNLRPDGTIGEPERGRGRRGSRRGHDPRRSDPVECTTVHSLSSLHRHDRDGVSIRPAPARRAVPALRGHRPAGASGASATPTWRGPNGRTASPAGPPVAARRCPRCSTAASRARSTPASASACAARPPASTGSRPPESGRGWRTGRGAGSSARRSTD